MIKDLTKGNPLRLILELSIPLILSAVLQQLYNTVDAYIVGNFVGDSALAAVGLSFPIMFLITSIIIGMSIGVSVIVAQYFGAGDHLQMKKSISTAFIFLLITCVIVSILGYFLTDWILATMQTPPEVFNYASDYLKIIFIGTVFTLLFNLYSAILRAVGDTKTPLIFLMITAVLNMVLDYIFVVNFNMATSGAALATIISQGVSGFLCLLYIKKRIPILDLKRNEYVFDKEKFSLILKYGIPTAVQMSVISLGNMIVQSLVNSYGVSVMAGYTSGIRIDSFIIMPYINVGTALSTYVAQNVGAREFERVKHGLLSAYKIIIALTIVLVPIIWIFSERLVSIFLDQSSVESIKVGGRLLRDLSIFYIIFGLVNNTSGLLRGAGDNVWSLFGSITSIITRVIAAYGLTNILGYRSIWYGAVLGWVAAYVLILARYFSGKWKEKSIFQRTIDSIKS